MDIYKLKSLALIFIIYLIAMLPSFAIFCMKENNKNIKSFINHLCISTFIEIVIFSLVYAFTREAVSIFGIPKNIENYSIYALKILFIGSILTPIHFGFPIYLFKNKKKKKAVILFSLKIIYIPILAIMNFAFSTKIALFTMPVLDLIYSMVLLLNIIRNYI